MKVSGFLPSLAALAVALVACETHAQTSASAGTSGYRFDIRQQLVGTISPAPGGPGAASYLAVRHTYDIGGRLTKVETGSLAAWQSENIAPSAWTGFTIVRTVDITYDSAGRKIRETMREGTAGSIRTANDYSYDQFGRTECTAARMNPADFITAPLAACTQGTGAGDRITRNFYDAAGQRIQLREGVGSLEEGTQASWAYNQNGQVSTVVDGNGNRAALVYDGFGRQSCWMFPSAIRAPAFNDATQATALATAGSLSGTISGGQCSGGNYEAYTYDANDNRITLRKRDGTILSYTYDNLNRLTVKTVPERPAPHPQPLTATYTRDVYYGYDLRNLQLYARFDSSSGEGVTNLYDGFGRLLTSTLNMDGINRAIGSSYDTGGRRTQITQPDGLAFTYTYDGLDRLTGLYQGTGTSVMLAEFTYNAQGLPATRVERYGSSVTYGYDLLGRLTSQTNALVGGVGNVTFGLGRNAASQIDSRTVSNDAYAWTGHYAVQRPYTTNGRNQYSTAGSTTLSSDDNGNLLSEVPPSPQPQRHYTYDVENRLVAAGPSAGIANASMTLRYDPLGRLYEVSGPSGTRRFVWDRDALVNEYNAAGTMTNRYVHGGNQGADDPLVWYDGVRTNFFHTDHQGSVIAIAYNGSSPPLNAYDEYGIPRAGNTGPFQYTGQLWLPDLGMYHYKARIYSPTLGRFLQVDPVGYDDQVNLYAYVANDPVNRQDPTGTQWENFYIPGVDQREFAEAYARETVALGRGILSFPRDVGQSVMHYVRLSGLSGEQARNRALLIEQLGSRALRYATANPAEAARAALRFADANFSFLLGRGVAGIATSLATRGLGAIFGITAVHGGAVTGLNRLVSQLENGGIDIRSFNNNNINSIVTAGGLGANLNFDSRTGNVTATVDRTPTGSRLIRREEEVICNVHRGC